MLPDTQASLAEGPTTHPDPALLPLGQQFPRSLVPLLHRAEAWGVLSCKSTKTGFVYFGRVSFMAGTPFQPGFRKQAQITSFLAEPVGSPQVTAEAVILGNARTEAQLAHEAPSARALESVR